MKTLRRSLTYLAQYKWLAFGAFLMMNLVTGLSLLIPQFIREIIDNGITIKNLSVIQQVSLGLLLVTLVRSFASFFRAYWAQKASQGIAYDIRNQMIHKLEFLAYYNKESMKVS